MKRPDPQTTIITPEQTERLLVLENQRAELKGEIARLQAQEKALDNAIWRLTGYAQSLRRSA